MQTDPKLGYAIHKLLVNKGIETPMNTQRGEESITEQNVRSILVNLGLDLNDDSLEETPRRVAKMFHREIFGGLNYDNFPACTTVANKMGCDEMVLVRNIVLRSTCEHHLQPIYGVAHVGYLPNPNGKIGAPLNGQDRGCGKILGLSKLSRVVTFFAARPQVQERLTEQIYAALSHILETEDVAVVIEAEHFCMKMRGVKDPSSVTTTSKMGGRFRTVDSARMELLQLIRRP